MRRPLVLVLLALPSCVDLKREPDPQAGGLIEPDVFDVIRAGNSKAAVEALRDRYEQEVQHARLLEARIGELIAAEEGLALEHHERLQALQSIKDEVRKLADEQAALGRALEDAARGKAKTGEQLEALRQENEQLEAAIAAEEARREELRRRLDEAKRGAAPRDEDGARDGS
jgi:chromosome segregation ATPase